MRLPARIKKLGFRIGAAPAALILLGQTDGFDYVGKVVEILIAVALPALILLSIVKLIMNHLRA